MSELGDFLDQLPLPDSSGARERTAALMAAAAPSAVRPSRITNSWKVSVGVALTLLAAFFAATPPGRSAITWAAEQVGIGEVGGPPSVSDRSENATPSSAPVVIGTGSAPNGDPYEFVAYMSKDAGKSPGPCIYVDFPGAGAETGPGAAGGGICPDAAQGAIQPIQLVSTTTPPDADPYVFGIAAPGTERVLIRPAGQADFDADVGTLEGELQERIGSPTPLTAFVAFPPEEVGLGAHGRSIEVVALDDAGAELGRDRLAHPKPRQPDAAIVDVCREALASGMDNAVCESLVEAAENGAGK